MRLSQDVARHNHSPEYRQALQELIKYEIQALIERLSATGEEAFILTASVRDGTSTQLGSQKGEGFLLKQSELSQNFLSFCSDDGIHSSADELGSYGEENSPTPQKEDEPVVPPNTYPSLRSRDRISITEDRPTGNLFEVTPASVLYASERNDSVSSVSSFVAASQEDENDLQCKICTRSFRSYKTLSQHVRLHMAKSYKCGVCGKIFSVKKRYQQHIKSHNNYKPLECGICDKSFVDQYSWKRHRELHLEDRNFSCNLCGKAFFEKYSLRVHQTSHFSSPSKTDKTAGYSCHICQKISKTKTAMKTHLLTHSAKKHVCEFCNKRFSLHYSYVRHRRIHTGEKPYKCGSCDKSFSDGSAWAKHVRTHSGIKPYSCSTCSKSFFDKTTCKKHMKSHQNKRQVRLADREKRNFEEVSSEKTSSIITKKTDVKTTKLTFDLSDSESQLFDTEDLCLSMEAGSGKAFDDHALLPQEIAAGSGRKLSGDVTEEKVQLEPLLESVQLDDMFQKDFVDRNMPSKAIESDNEFITANLPDILADETEGENQTEMDKNFGLHQQDLHEAKGYNIETSPQKPLPKFPHRSRRTMKEKFFLDSQISKCKKCHKTFKSELLLKQHQQFKCMLKLYKCRYCGKQLSTKNSLVRHERIHVGNRPYQCNICQKSFADNYGCIRHIKHHFNKDNNRSVSRSSTQSEQKNLSGSTMKNHLKSHDLTKDVVSPVTETYAKTSPVSQKSPAHMSPAYRSESGNLTSSLIQQTDTTPTLGVPYSENQYTGDNTALSNVPSTLAIGKDGLSQVENKSYHLFKCSLCAAMFASKELCVNHVQQHCSAASGNNDSSPTQTVYPPTSTATTELSNLFQCSLCLQMFTEKLLCQKHVDSGCGKIVSDEATKTAVDSILNDSLSYSDISTPTACDSFSQQQQQQQQQQYPDLASSENFIDISSGHVVLLSKPFSASVVVSTTEVSPTTISPVATQVTTPTQPNSTYIKLTPQPSLCHVNAQSYKEGGNSEAKFTSVVQKPVTSLGLATPGKFLVTEKGLSLVESHLLKSVTKSEKLKKGETDISERTCTICNKVFTNKHILKQHMLTHMEKKFGCKFCMKKFHNKYGRDRHERIHTGEKPFSCPNCKKAFSDNSTYRKHTRVCCGV